MITFKLTAKRTIAGKIPKGTTFQVVSRGITLTNKPIAEAINRTFGTNLKPHQVSTTMFDKEKL